MIRMRPGLIGELSDVGARIAGVLKQAIGGRLGYLEHLKYMPSKIRRFQERPLEQMRLPL